MLELHSVSKRFGAIVVADAIDLTLVVRRGARRDRAERRRQVDAVQPDHRPAAAGCRPHRPRWRRHHPSLHRRRAAAPASDARSRSRSRSTISSVFEKPCGRSPVRRRVCRRPDAVQHCGRMLDPTGLEAKANRLAGSLPPLLDRSGSSWRGRWPPDRARCCSTRSPAGSPMPNAMSWWRPSEPSTPRGSPSSGSSMWCTRCSRWCSGWSCSISARSLRKGVPTEVMRSREVETIYMGVPA